ncbi:anti-sigma factor [Microbacterium sp. 1P10UB]|uniref:anti-sigma factor n=1 Tax=unclassified Microbacterium TaxID=2609290 RepID=UPI0039A039FF
MSHPESEILALMAMGESVASPEERAHIEDCPGCREELSRLRHAVDVGRATIDVGELDTPAPIVWTRIADELQLSDEVRTDAAAAASATTEAPARPEPGPAPVADTATRRSRRGGGRRPVFRAQWILAAAVVLVLGVGAGTWAVVRQLAPTPVAQAALDAFPDHPGASGTAVVDRDSDGADTVTVTLNAPNDPNGYREVWLITADATALVSLGVLDGDEGTFTIPSGVDLNRYVLVDISDEPVDGDPTHSGDSIVRGQLSFG